MSKHTPKPWYAAKTGNHQGLVISEATSENVAVTYNGDEDAALIVRAVNAHDELLAACKAFLQIFENGTHYDTQNPYTRPEVKAAIAAVAKAEGRD